MENKNDNFYYKIFDDICKGSSQIEIFGKVFYAKHPLVSDFVAMESFRDKEFKKCVDMGILTKAEFIDKLKADGIYPYEIENRIKEIDREIESIQAYIKTQIRKIIKEREKIKIKRLEEELFELKGEFESLIFAENADSISAKRSHDFFISNSIYIDREFNMPAFPNWHELNKSELQVIYDSYSSFGENLSPDNVENLVVREFFKPYYDFCESCQDFYGKPAIELSKNQSNLIYLARLFKNIFKNYGEKIPDSIRNDAKAIIEHVNGVTVQEEMMEKSERRAEKSGSNFNISTKFGATKQDYIDAGIDGKFMDLSELTKGGKTLNTQEAMQAFAKQAGIK